MTQVMKRLVQRESVYVGSIVKVPRPLLLSEYEAVRRF